MRKNSIYTKKFKCILQDQKTDIDWQLQKNSFFENICDLL